MADVKLYESAGTYPVVELTGINNLGVSEIKSCKKASAFTTALMNGMCVTVGEVSNEATLPSAGTAKVWLHASVEKLYRNDQTRKDFAILNNDGFLPRCYRLKQAQFFETNAVIFDASVFKDYAAIKAYVSGAVYAYPDTTGLWRLAKSLPLSTDEPVTYGEAKCITLPNGDDGVEITMTKVTY